MTPSDTSVKDTNPKDAVGSRKLPWHVIPFRVLAGVVLAFFGGALKYRAFNYRIAGVRASVYIDAAIRHILRFAEGEDWDPDVKGYNKEDPSKGVLIHHIDEAIAGLMVLRDSMLIGNWTDDRAPSISPSWIDEANEMAGRIIDANPDPKRNWTQAEVVKGRAVAAALEAFDNTGPAPATPAPASLAHADADTPEPVPPTPFLPTHDTEPGPLSPEVALPGRAAKGPVPEGIFYEEDTTTFRLADGTSVDGYHDDGTKPVKEIDPLTFYHAWSGRSSDFPRYVEEEA